MLDRPSFATSHDLATLDGVEKSERTNELNDGWLTESFSRPRVHPRSVVPPSVPLRLRPFEEAKSFNLLIFHDETTTRARARLSPFPPSLPSANFRICAVAVVRVRPRVRPRPRPSVSQPSHFLLFEYLEDSEDGWTDGRGRTDADGRTSCGGADSLPRFLSYGSSSRKERGRREREGIRVWRVNFGVGE